MIEERMLKADDLWAVIQNQRAQVDRLVSQAERLQAELANVRSENRRLAGRLAELDRATTDVQPVPHVRNQSVEWQEAIETGDAAAPASHGYSVQPRVTPVGTSMVHSIRVHSMSTSAIAARALVATIILMVCAWTAGTVSHASQGVATHPAHVVVASQR